MKTAAAVLQEYAVKLGLTPEYECISQSGPQHLSTFEYRCTLCNESATATARSKKEAKQESARGLLIRLSKAGHSIPPPWGMEVPNVGMGTMGGIGAMGGVGAMGGLGAMGGIRAAPMFPPTAPDPHSYVALLKEYCEEYKLPQPEYELIGDSGPPHLRSFTIRVTVGSHLREATALNKKAARQIAAEAIYKYLRGCLRSTQDFVEVLTPVSVDKELALQPVSVADAWRRCERNSKREDAIARSIDKKMGRFKEERKEIPWRPPLNQRISDYHLGLNIQFDENKRAMALEALRTTASAGQSPEVQLSCAASELGLELEWAEMPSTSDKPLLTVCLPTTTPTLVYMGDNRDQAAEFMVNYLLMSLPNPKRALVSMNLDNCDLNSF